MTTVYLSPIGNAWQFFGSDGLPLNAGKLYTYAAGTTTPQVTYTTSAGSVQNANPIILNADGRLPNEVWLTTDSYRFDLKDSLDNLIGSYDDIGALEAAFTASSGSSLIGFLAAGTGATAQNLQAWARARPVNLVDFLPPGYVLDGSVDYTTQIGNWLTACAGRCGIAPAGTFLFTNFTVSADTTLRGAGRNATKFNTATTGNAVTLGGHRIHFEDMWINQSSGAKQGKGIVGTDRYYFTTARIDVTGFDYDAYLDKSLYHSHKDSHFTGGNHGLYYWGAAGQWNLDWYNNQIVLDNVISQGATIGCYIKGLGVSIPMIDVSSSAVGLSMSGDSASNPGVFSVGEIYSELSNIPVQMSYAYGVMGGGKVQGGAAVGTPFSEMFLMDNSRLIITGELRGLDYWTNTGVLTNSSRLEANQTIGFGAAVASGNSVDATSHVYVTDYEEGTFTATLTGCTTSPTGTVSYVKEGKFVTLLMPTIDATSNSTAATLTGLPASITPATSQFVPCNVIDTGGNLVGMCTLANSGVLHLYKDASLTDVFTNTGLKGIQGPQTLSYTLF